MKNKISHKTITTKLNGVSRTLTCKNPWAPAPCPPNGFILLKLLSNKYQIFNLNNSRIRYSLELR